jgi:hypothetical protein
MMMRMRGTMRAVRRLQVRKESIIGVLLVGVIMVIQPHCKRDTQTEDETHLYTWLVVVNLPRRSSRRY